MTQAADRLRLSIEEIRDSSLLGTRIRALTAARPDDFRNPLHMQLAAIGGADDAREYLDDRLDAIWRMPGALPGSAQEVIIGGGLHAAVYAAARTAAGFPKPVILEASDRPGGCLAVSKLPSFYLNSRNRPGLLGQPGEDQALNYLPGAPAQPADISDHEFQPNTHVAFLIRAMLALHGDVFTGRTATAVDCSGPLPRVEVKGLPAPLRAGRVLDARGFGDPAGSAAADGKLIMTAPQWMAGMDASFPLQGLRRVAVAGDGDYAKGVIESLFGMGPGTHHVTGLDRVERVDWYAPGLPTDCDAWRVTQRLRHARIGALLRGRRLKIIQSNARAVRSLDSVIVNGITYDCVIMATGWERKLLAGVPGASALDRTVGSPTVLARTTVEGTYYGLGPVAEIPFSALEARGAVGRLTGNRDAIFRLVNRTAALAMQLPAPVLVA